MSLEDADRFLRGQAAPDVAAPTQARGAAPGQAALRGTSTPVGSDPIAALAQGLRNNPDLIFEYVYNNIDYEPLFGSNKGALGTLLDGRGNAFDQSRLLVALLNAAGIAQTTYCYGNIRLNSTTENASGWLGVANTASSIRQVFSNGGIPTGGYSANPDGTLDTLSVGHVWVLVNLGGTALPASACTSSSLPANTFVFDPSFKQYEVAAGLANLPGVLGYTRSAFLTTAGGTLSGDTFSNVNRAAARGALAGYANSLVAYIRTNMPTATVSDIVGGKVRIIPLAGSPIRVTSAAYATRFATSAVQTWATIPDPYRAYFTVRMPGATVPQAVPLYADATYGRRVTLFSVPSGANFVPTLLVDGAVPACVATGTCVNTGPATPSGGSWSVGLAITHPYADAALRAAANQSGDVSLRAGGSYVVQNGWGQVGRGMVEWHRGLLGAAQASGGAAASEGVLGESLAVMGYSWLSQVSSAQRLTDRLVRTTTQYHHGLGIVAQTAVQGSSSQGPYVDLPFNFLGITPQASTSGISTPLLATFLTASGISSVLESGVIEQTQALTPGVQAASTVRLIDQNVIPATNTTYLATGTLPSGLSNYSASDQTRITAALGTGAQVLLPQNGNQSVGTVPWTGAGYTIITQTANSLGASQIISGGLSGGQSGTDIPTHELNFNATQTIDPTPAAPQPGVNVVDTSPAPYNPQTLDPVDAVTGAYVYSRTDLVTGGGAFPYALPFGRTYRSSAYLSNAGLGSGWTHTYSLAARVNSEPYEGFGEGLAVNAATGIAALYVSQDLLGVQPRDARNLTLAAIAQRWLMDSLTNNAVMIDRPDTSEGFILLADGTFNPPPASGAQLLCATGGVPCGSGPASYVYRGVDGTQLVFGALDAARTGRIATWSHPNGAAVTLAYDGFGRLSTVQNNLASPRTLTLSYGAGGLTSVSDGSRSVSYAYSVTPRGLRLDGATDPAGFTTSYSYDTTGTLDSEGRLTGILPPTTPATSIIANSYDAFGRVYRQANANGQVSNLHFAGSRSEVIGPTVGGFGTNRSVTYQDPRGRVILDARVLLGSFGNVYNDTTQAGAAGGANITTNAYDGLSRLTRTTAPEGNRVETTYDAYALPLTVTRYPKSGSPLSPLVQTFTYASPVAARPNFRRVATATDPRTNTTTYGYDAATGNLLTVTAPAVTRAGSSTPTNPVTTYAYTTVGLLASETDAENRVTAYTYDGAGNRTAMVVDSGTGRLNLRTTYGYNAAGDATSVVSPRGNVSGGTPATYQVNQIYDARRNRIQRYQTSTGMSTTYAYDGESRLVATDEFVWLAGSRPTSRRSTITYTPTGQRATETDASGAVVTYAYDGADRLLSTTWSSGRQTVYGLDLLSRVTAVSDGLSGTLDPSITRVVTPTPTLRETRTYTANGLLASSRDGNSNLTAFRYDGFDRPDRITYADTRTEDYGYDAGSNRTSRVTRAGQTITWTYDALNRPLTRVVPASPNPVTYTTGYDLVGRIVTLRQSTDAVDTQYGYDLAGRLTSETNADGRVVGYGLDADGNRIGLTWPETGASAYAVTYAYDPAGRMTSAVEGAVNLATMAYDTASQRRALAFGNGAGASYTWRPSGRVETLRHGFAANASVTFTYVYNRENALSGRLVSDDRYMPGASNPALTPGTRAYVPNAINGYTTVAGTALAYDLNANFTGDGTATYAYDAENRLLSATLGGVTTTYAYDPQGRRRSRTTAGATTRFLSAGDQEIAEYTGAGLGTIAARFVPGPGLDEPFATVVGDGAGRTRTYHHADGLGSVVALTDGTGAVTARYPYTPFGVADANTGSPWRFAGRRLDPETGLYYQRARYYSPLLGRFLQLDPIGQTGGLNLYAYVANDPLNRTDPLGLSSVESGFPNENIVLAANQDEPVPPGAIRSLREVQGSSGQAGASSATRIPTFSPIETQGLRQLFGRGPEGAQALISRLEQGSVALPPNVTPQTLRAYEQIAQRAISEGKDLLGVQAQRLEAIRRILGQ